MRKDLIGYANIFTAATNHIDEVMNSGADKHPDDFWKTLPIEEHLRRADVHWELYKAGGDENESADVHLDHHLVRVCMIIQLLSEK